MYCWNCGKEIDDQVTFCPHCGMKQAEPVKPPREKPQRGILIPVICAAVCVGALLGMVLLLSGDKETPPEPPAITQEKAEPETTRATQAKETEEATQDQESKVDPYSAELPDLASFLDTSYTQDEWGYTHYVTCLVDREDKTEVVEDVLELLKEPRYQLEQMDKDSDSDGTHYTFQYTGKNEDIDWVYLKSGGKYHVKLTVKSYGGSQTALILYTFPEFYLEDPGSRSRYAEKTETKKSDSDSGGGSLYEDKCWYCGGDGRCNNCGGSGHYNQWAGDMYVNVRCTQCNGGSCRQCGGDGKN